MKKTGGIWNANERSMYFFAGSDGTSRKIGSLKNNTRINHLYAVNDFATVGKKLNKTGTEWQLLLRSLEGGRHTFLDSGIFNLTNVHMRKHGTTMDEALALAPEEIDNFDWLFDTYVEMCSELGDQLWGYNELDQGGRENKIRTRERIEKLGLTPIPVYHPLNDGWDYFDNLASNYDRMCFGNVVQAGPVVRLKLLLTAFERHMEYPDLFIHFLGLTPNELQMSLPFDSADSSTYTSIVRYPQAFRFAAGGRKRWDLPPSWLPPLKGTEKEYELVVNLSISELYSNVQNIGHYNETMIRNIGTSRYHSGVTND